MYGFTLGFRSNATARKRCSAELEQTGRAALGPPGQDAQATCTEKNSYSKEICIFLD